MREAILVVIIVVLVVVIILILGRRPLTGPSAGRPPTADPYAAQYAAEAERVSRNTQEYSLDQLPTNTDTLTLLRFSFAYRDECLAMVYLLAGQEPIKTGFKGAMDVYLHYSPLYTRAIWAWRGDNLYDKMTWQQVRDEKDRRHEEMLKLLQSGGWQISAQRYPSVDLVPDIEITYLKKG